MDVGLNDRREAASAGTGDEFVDDFAQIIGAEADILLELELNAPISSPYQVNRSSSIRSKTATFNPASAAAKAAWTPA